MLDRVHLAARGDAAGLALRDGIAAARLGRLVALLDEQPVVAALAVAPLQAHQHPAAVQLGAVQDELEIALLVAGGGIPVGLPPAAIPQHHGAAAVLAGRDDALEAAILDRVVLDMDRQALDGRIEARPLWHRPALQHAVELEPEVVMRPAGHVLLDHEARLGGAAGAPRAGRAGRLGGAREIALAVVFAQPHRRHTSLPMPKSCRKTVGQALDEQEDGAIGPRGLS